MSYNDVFKEQLVTRKKTPKDTLKKIGLIAAGVLVALISLLPFIAQYGLSFIVIVIVIWVEIIFLKRFNVEFEYSLTNTDLDIDKIFNRYKRKHAFTLDVRSIIVMLPLKHPSFKSEVGNITKIYDFSEGTVSDTTYAAVFERDGQRNQLIFDPNEVLFNAIKMYIPKKVK